MTRADPGQVFTEVAPVWRDPPTRADRIARRAVAHLRAGGHVLDVGCGTGAVLDRVRREAWMRNKAIGHTVGVDIASGMAQRSRRRGGIKTCVGDAVALPFVDQYFDVVIAADVMQFVDDPDRAIRDLFRVTLPGGTIILELALPSRIVGLRRSDVSRLPRWSLLRRYVEMRRTYAIKEIKNTLVELGCAVREARSPVRREGQDGTFLARIGRRSASSGDLAVARSLTKLNGHAVAVSRPIILIARLPGPRRGGVRVEIVDLPRWTPERVERLLRGLPPARGYTIEVKPLRWRTRPHVQAFCEFAPRKIVIQIPTPFFPFSEDVPYRAKRMRRRGRWRFRWYWRRLAFDRPDELVRYLYLHEYYHWYLREVRGKPSAAETACDRFALQRLGAKALERLGARGSARSG